MITRDLDDDLELARRHVAEGEERVIAQRKRLAKMIEAGSNERGVVNAKRLLQAFENALAAMRDHLAVEENTYKRF